eukprot:931921-Pleurochrysis_carterae.AAC.2
MKDPKLSRARARRPPHDESFRTQCKRLVARAQYDGYARYRADTRPRGVSLSAYACDDAYSRYDAREPHPFDDDGAVLVSYVDPITHWPMYKYNDDY